MQIARVFSFLTYPSKGRDDVPEVTGTEIPVVDNKLCRMLDAIFSEADADCNIPIMFTSEHGNQTNDVRTEILQIRNTRRLTHAAMLGNRLQRATGKQSGLALLFICLGTPQDDRMLIARFPADEGVVAEQANGGLTVQFVEQVFLKSAHAYKAVLYKGADGNDFWGGHAVDRQINHGAKAVADYWIIDFLKSDLQSTAAQGTKRLAVALRAALSNTSSANVRQEVSMAAQLARNLSPRLVLSIPEWCNALNLSEDSKKAIVSEVKPSRLLESRFRFDQGEFSRHIAYKSVELDNGALLSAQVSRFDECFDTEVSDADPTIVTFSTSGKVVEERLRRSR